jgi:hypothetical protein
MRGRALIWITVIQVAAAVGAAILPASPSPDASTTSAMRTICTHVEEPSVTALRLFVEVTGLRQSAPNAPWEMLLTLFAMPLNIFVWSALWRGILRGSMTCPGEEDWTSRTLRRDTVDLPAAGVERTWSFPSSMKSVPRR